MTVTKGRVTLTRRRHQGMDDPQTLRASFDGGEALAAVLRDGDQLRCWRGPTAEIGVSVGRAGSVVLGLGTLGRTPGGDITIDHDPRAGNSMLAGEIRYIERPGTRIVWLDPARPSELEAQVRGLDGDLSGVNVLAIVVRTDDRGVYVDLNQRIMGRNRPGLGAAVFLQASEQFASLDEWLHYGRALSTDRPRDLWMRVRIGASECLIPEGTTATVEDWLVHVHRVYEPGMPGRLSQLGLVRTDAGVTPAVLERSTAATAKGLT